MVDLLKKILMMGTEGRLSYTIKIKFLRKNGKNELCCLFKTVRLHTNYIQTWPASPPASQGGRLTSLTTRCNLEVSDSPSEQPRAIWFNAKNPLLLILLHMIAQRYTVLKKNTTITYLTCMLLEKISTEEPAIRKAENLKNSGGGRGQKNNREDKINPNG